MTRSAMRKIVRMVTSNRGRRLVGNEVMDLGARDREWEWGQDRLNAVSNPVTERKLRERLRAAKGRGRR